MKKFLSIIVFLTYSVTTLATVKFINSSNLDLGHFNKIKCATGITCAQSSGNLLMTVQGPLTLTGGIAGDGGDTLVGLIQNQIASTTTTLTIAQCGSTIVNNSADVVSLPEASTALGCRYTFIVGNVSNFDVNPDNADQIMLLTDAAGDAIRADAIGESITLEAISASAWAPVGAEKGTWTDIN